MTKNPTTPPRAARKSSRGSDNRNPLWAPKVEKNTSLSTQKKRKREEIEEVKDESVQIKFFYGATQQGKRQCRLLREVLAEKINELKEIEDRQAAAVVMPRMEFNQFLAPGMWGAVTGPAMNDQNALHDGLTTGESSEVSSDNESGQTTPRCMTPII